MNANSTRYSIKVPSNTEIVNNCKNGYVLIKGPLHKKLCRTLFKIQLCNESKFLYVTSETVNPRLPNKQKKHKKSLRGTDVAMLTKSLLEVSTLTYKTLNLIGVGYKVFSLENQILHFKLGFSHSIYYKVPKGLNINSKQANKLLIFGNSSLLVSQTACSIKKFKKPEPYKGKGILYGNEKINLKEGKKV